MDDNPGIRRGIGVMTASSVGAGVLLIRHLSGEIYLIGQIDNFDIIEHSAMPAA